MINFKLMRRDTQEEIKQPLTPTPDSRKKTVTFKNSVPSLFQVKNSRKSTTLNKTIDVILQKSYL